MAGPLGTALRALVQCPLTILETFSDVSNKLVLAAASLLSASSSLYMLYMLYSLNTTWIAEAAE